jgi:diguanylate cyclase (GGDEF)-like protein
MLPNNEGFRDMESRSGVIRDIAGTIRYVAVVSFDITERKHRDSQVHDMAFSDALTGLPNRRLMHDRLQQTLAASKRSGRYNALVFIDLDNFKPINDRHGHAVGDQLLIEVSKRLRNLIREDDTLARLGGDEFVVILGALGTGTAESMAQAQAIVEKISLALSKPYFFAKHDDGGKEVAPMHSCTASIGVALFSDHKANPADIINWADLAMYQAKKAGRNAIRFHVPAD